MTAAGPRNPPGPGLMANGTGCGSGQAVPVRVSEGGWASIQRSCGRLAAAGKPSTDLPARTDTFVAPVSYQTRPDDVNIHAQPGIDIVTRRLEAVVDASRAPRTVHEHPAEQQRLRINA